MKSRLYTRSGDNGTTSLVGGSRVPKDCERLEAYGTIDELNSWLGILASSESISSRRRAEIRVIQNRLFDIGAALATETDSAWQPDPFPEDAIMSLEGLIDEIDSQLPALRHFILPGGHIDAARANVARTVARRAERRIITMNRIIPVDPAIIRYVNRISDFLFALGREININNSTEEFIWQKNCR